MGIAGLSRVLAMEGASAGIRSNAIAPYAWTRMFEDVLHRNKGAAEAMEPIRPKIRSDQVGTFVAGLCADRDTTGQIFAVRGNEIFVMSQPRPIQGIADANGWTPESIVARGLPALRHSYYDLKGTGDHLNWEPV
jgi:hypothetical protein